MPVKERELLAKELYNVTLKTLETIPGRSLTFLRGAGTNRVIFAALQRRGYDILTHRQGWELLQKTCTSTVGPIEVEMAPEVAGAVAKADEIDGDLIRIITVVLKHPFPEQLTCVLRDIKPSTGMEAVSNCAQIVRGLNELESGASRTSTRKQDAEALELLAVRGIDAEYRAMLAALVDKATSTPETKPRTPAELAAEDEAYVRSLGDLWIWYEEWSEIARVEVKRRDRLIQLGLAQRKAPGKEEEEEPEEPAGGGAPV